MISLKRIGYTLVFLMAVAALLSMAQTNTAPPPSTSGQGTTGANRGSGGPCLRQAGISQSVAQKIRQIEHNTRSQLQSVCHDSSLSTEQKKEKAKQLRDDARKQMEALITPQQREQLKACREQRRPEQSNKPQAQHRGGGNPCGEMGSANQSEENDSDQQEPQQ